MNSTNLANWVQIVSGIALLVGIGLVIWELQQARQIAQTQFTSESFDETRQANLAMIGEKGAEVFARACDTPDSLSSEDARIMEAITWNELNRLLRRFALYQAGGFYGDDPEIGWSRFGRSHFTSIFDTQFGRNWWNTTRSYWPPEIVAIGDGALASIAEPECRQFYNRLLGKHES